MSCCDCGCDCCGDEREPTPEELAARREREDVRLALRMTPARSPIEQMDRDLNAMAERLSRDLNEAMFSTTPPEAQFSGLAAWLPPTDAAASFSQE